MTYVASASNVGSIASLAVTIPGAASAGDVAWAVLACVDTVTVTTPAGWTLADSGTNGNLQYLRYFKVLAGGDPGSNVTFSATSANKMTALLVVDDDAVSPFEGSETPAEVSVNASDTNRTNPSTTLTAARTAYSWVVSRGSATLTTWTAPAGWTRVQQAFNTGSGETNGAVAYRAAGAGSVGGDDWVSDTADLRGTTILVVVEPGASGPTETSKVPTSVVSGSESGRSVSIVSGGSELSRAFTVVE